MKDRTVLLHSEIRTITLARDEVEAIVCQHFNLNPRITQVSWHEGMHLSLVATKVEDVTP